RFTAPSPSSEAPTPAGRPWCNQSASYSQANAKQKQRKSPCISLDSFGRIWTFQRVTAEKNKNNAPFPTRVSGCRETSLGCTAPLLHALPVATDALPGPKFRSAEILTSLPGIA